MDEAALKGKVVLVTGSASGIGAACVQRLVRAGALAISADINIAEPGKDAVRVDVADPASVEEALTAIIDRHGRLDGLVHSAGIARSMPFLDTALGDFDSIVRVNLRGTFIVGQAAANAMVRTGGGSIVNVASVSGMLGNGQRSAYGTSKAAVIHLTKVMAVELASHGIRVNAVSPGPINTPMVDAFYSDAIRKEWTDRVPMHRFGSPHDVAATIAFLCSDDASYITGQTLAVDGGFVIAGIRDRG